MEQPRGADRHDRYQWDDTSTYVHRPPFFDGMTAEPAPLADIVGARCLAKLGRLGHHRPHLARRVDRARLARPVGGSSTTAWPRRTSTPTGPGAGNHEVMIRGTFANIRLRNQLAPGTEGGWTRHQPERRADDHPRRRHPLRRRRSVPLIILAGTEYGSGSSRDWAAKGTLLLGVRAVIAESFERIHRSNLIGMGVLPLQFARRRQRRVARPHRHRDATPSPAWPRSTPTQPLPDRSRRASRSRRRWRRRRVHATVRIDTPKEADYYRHGGILHYVLRQLAR